MASAGPVRKVWMTRPTIEGAGVRLKRALGPFSAIDADPFLLLDDFHSDDPEDYIAGFPWHPHRGIETVTYMIEGVVDHGDSIGNRGSIASGDVQWMTAGGGILHQEMPRAHDGTFRGFQLWVNLPSSKKMMAPRYRDVKRDQIPVSSPAPGIEVRVIAGRLGSVVGPVRDLVVDVEYLDVALGPDRRFRHVFGHGWTSLAYTSSGTVSMSGTDSAPTGPEHVVLFEPGAEVVAQAGVSGARLLLISGRPLREPIAWGGPIVMNTEAELDLAFRELREGTFVRRRAGRGRSDS